jgi:hypothetical protein
MPFAELSEETVLVHYAHSMVSWYAGRVIPPRCQGCRRDEKLKRLPPACLDAYMA